MRKFVFKTFLFSSPILLLCAVYVINDPFKVIYAYTDYSYSKVVLNRDYVSMEVFNNRRDIEGYNSFLLGSSRTLAFSPNTWSACLNDTSAHVFVYDASGETLEGIEKKIKYIDSVGMDLKNVIILLCRDVWFTKNNPGHLHRMHHLLTREPYISFQSAYLNTFFNFGFLKAYLKYLVTDEITAEMSGFLEEREILIDSITNHMTLKSNNELLSEDSALFYSKMMPSFELVRGKSKLVEKVDEVRLTNELKRMLTNINRIFKKHNTKYKIVLTPLYEQIKFNPSDKLFLADLFGKQLYDYTGRNELTDDYHNYYEAYHFLPSVGDSILFDIYNKQIK